MNCFIICLIEISIVTSVISQILIMKCDYDSIERLLYIELYDISSLLYSLRKCTKSIWYFTQRCSSMSCDSWSFIIIKECIKTDDKCNDTHDKQSEKKYRFIDIEFIWWIYSQFWFLESDFFFINLKLYNG